MCVRDAARYEQIRWCKRNDKSEFTETIARSLIISKYENVDWVEESAFSLEFLAEMCNNIDNGKF